MAQIAMKMERQRKMANPIFVDKLRNEFLRIMIGMVTTVASQFRKTWLKDKVRFILMRSEDMSRIVTSAVSPSVLLSSTVDVKHWTTNKSDSDVVIAMEWDLNTHWHRSQSMGR